ALLLLLGSEAEDRDATQPHVGEERGREAAVDAPDLLDQETAHHHVAAAAAVLLGVADAEVAEAAELLEEVLRERLRLLELVDARGERLLGEAAHGETKALLLLVQAESEHGSVLRRGTLSGRSRLRQGSAIASVMAEAATV